MKERAYPPEPWVEGNPPKLDLKGKIEVARRDLKFLPFSRQELHFAINIVDFRLSARSGKTQLDEIQAHQRKAGLEDYGPSVRRVFRDFNRFGQYSVDSLVGLQSLAEELPGLRPDMTIDQEFTATSPGIRALAHYKDAMAAINDEHNPGAWLDHYNLLYTETSDDLLNPYVQGLISEITVHDATGIVKKSIGSHTRRADFWVQTTQEAAQHPKIAEMLSSQNTAA